MNNYQWRPSLNGKPLRARANMSKWGIPPARNRKGKKKEFLENKFDRFLFILHLNGVEDPLDAKPLWCPKYGGGHKIKDASGNKKNRLHAALDKHRAIRARKATVFEEEVEDYRVFSDVLIFIPKKYWVSAIKARGVELSLMISQLERLHLRHFKGSLLNNRLPHYCIMPQDDLADDEVICYFGLSVFIPSEKDKQTADLNLTYQYMGYPFKEWIFWENNRRITRPVGLYEGQQYLQITPEKNQASFIAPTWFEHQQGYFQINLEESERRVANNTDSHQLFGDGKFVEEDHISNRFDTFSFHINNRKEKNDKLTFKITPTKTRNRVINEKYGEEADIAERLKSLTDVTDIDGSDFSPNETYQLLIKGIALPRFDTESSATMRYRRWQLAFNCRGMIQDLSNNASIMFTGYHDKSDLWLQRNNTKKPERLTIPIDINCGEYTYRLKKSPLSHHALLELPTQLAYQLKEEEVMLGREESATDITLNLLDKPNTILMDNDEFYSRSLNYRSFSGKHIEMKREGDILYVQQASQTSPFYILDKDYKIKKRFDPRSLESGEVALGEYLLVGCYLLAFDQQG